MLLRTTYFFENSSYYMFFSTLWLSLCPPSHKIFVQNFWVLFHPYKPCDLDFCLALHHIDFCIRLKTFPNTTLCYLRQQHIFLSATVTSVGCNLQDAAKNYALHLQSEIYKLFSSCLQVKLHFMSFYLFP